MSSSSPPPPDTDPREPLEDGPSNARAEAEPQPPTEAPVREQAAPPREPAAPTAATPASRPPRVHDVRSPRVSRSTKDSRRFFDASRAAAEARPASRPPRPQEDRRDPARRSAAPRFAAQAPTRAPGVPRGVVPGQPASIAPSKKSLDESVAPSIEVKPRAAEQPARAAQPIRAEPVRATKAHEIVEASLQSKPDEAAAASTRDPSEVLRVLTAPRVALKRPVQKSKPKTAKEAMKARAAAKSARGPASERARVEPASSGPRRRVDRKGRDEADDEARDSDADARASDAPEDAAPARLGLWQKIKRFFGR